LLHRSVYPGFVSLEDLALHLKSIYRDIGKRLDPYFAGFGDAALVVHRSGEPSDAALAPVASLSVVKVNEADVNLIALDTIEARALILNPTQAASNALAVSPQYPYHRLLLKTHHVAMDLQGGAVLGYLDDRCCIRAYVTRAW